MRSITFVILLILATLTLKAQHHDTTMKYVKLVKSAVLYNYFEIDKEVYKDTIDFMGSTGKIFWVRDRRKNKHRDTLFMPQPIGDTLIIKSRSGELEKDTIVSYLFESGATGFYIVGGVSPRNGAIHDYLFISWPDRKIPTKDPRKPKFWDILSNRAMTITIIKKPPSVSN